MNRFYSLIFIIALSLLSCNKSRKAVWMYYDETNCADKWTYTKNNEMLKDNVTSYLKSQKIKIYEMEIFNHTTAESCTACTCKTGRRYKLKVQRGDVDKAKSQGLFQ